MFKTYLFFVGGAVMYSRMNCFFIYVYVYYVLYRRYKTYIYIQKK